MATKKTRLVRVGTKLSDLLYKEKEKNHKTIIEIGENIADYINYNRDKKKMKRRIIEEYEF